MKLLMKVLLAASVVACAATSNANLIVNGSFEDSDVGTNQWKWFTSANVNGWDGSTIEIWDSLQNFDSYEGDQHAELNAHSNGGNVFSIFQTFATTAGETYDVSFAYAARTNNGEQFSYAIDDGSSLIDSQLFNNNLVKQWTLFNTSFVATGALSKIVFTSVTPSTGTLGNFLDNVVVTPGDELSTSNVSAPASVALMLVGVFGLMLSRRKAS
jgi:hypothetical protein